MTFAVAGKDGAVKGLAGRVGGGGRCFAFDNGLAHLGQFFLVLGGFGISTQELGDGFVHFRDDIQFDGI